MTLKFVLVCALVAAARAQSELSVNTTQGVIIGAKANDGDYFQFLGVHYGGSTAGDNRFKAPTPPPIYPGTFHAMAGTICTQPSDRGGLIGSEDCLTMNIFTNGNATLKPVLVWLQSEEYTISDNQQYSFKTLATEGIVVVVMNYRLSIFGFLCLGVTDAPGNAGLKDVIQGLKWVSENIAGFGGNPRNVVLFGQGSGAAVADLVTLSPASENLVHKAIIQSGSALAPWAIAYDPAQSARNVGDVLGYNDKNNEDLAKRLKETELSLFGTVLEYGTFANNTPQFAPCIENKNLNSNNTFLTDAPINIIRSGNYRQIPYIAGYTNREGTLRAKQAVDNHWLEKMQANFTNFLPVDLDFTRNLTIGNLTRQFYFGQRAINMETIEDYLDYHGDTMILISVIRGAWERALTSKEEVRLYEFAYRGTSNSDWLYPTVSINGAKHGVIQNFLLDVDLTQNDRPIMQSLIQRYKSFLNTGAPLINSAVDWPAISSSSFNYFYYIGDTNAPRSVFTESRVNPHQQRMTFWNGLYDNYYRTPNPVSSADKILSVVFTIFVGQLVVQLF